MISCQPSPDSMASTLPPMYVSLSSRWPRYMRSEAAVCLLGATMPACAFGEHAEERCWGSPSSGD